MSHFSGPIGTPPIVAVLFTYSWSGYCVRYRDGSRETFSPKQLLRRVGDAEFHRLNAIAHRLPGHWQAVEGGAE
jgi:hypothetical protein